MENNHFALLEFENVRKINFSRFNFQWWRPPTSDAIVVMYALNRYSHSPPPLSRREPGGARQVARSFELHQRTSPKEFLQFNGSAVHDLLLTRVKT